MGKMFAHIGSFRSCCLSRVVPGAEADNKVKDQVIKGRAPFNLLSGQFSGKLQGKISEDRVSAGTLDGEG